MISVNPRPLARTPSARPVSPATPKPPMHLAFDVYLDQVNTPEARASLLQSLKGQLKKGDTIWLAVEGYTVAKDPAVLDQLAAEKKAWASVLGPDGVQVKTRIRFERIHTDPTGVGSIRPGLADVYQSVLAPRQAQHQPIADAISYDYEAFRGFTGDEYTPHDTANAARLFGQGQRIAEKLGASYFVEPSVCSADAHPDPLHHVTLDWGKLSRYTDGFNFQTQRIVGGSSKESVGPGKLAWDRAAYAKSLGQLVNEVRTAPGAKKDWVMCQLSTEWSRPETVVAAAATARKNAKDLRSFYIWWYDTGRPEQTNVANLLAMVRLWNKTFRR